MLVTAFYFACLWCLFVFYCWLFVCSRLGDYLLTRAYGPGDNGSRERLGQCLLVDILIFDHFDPNDHKKKLNNKRVSQ